MGRSGLSTRLFASSAAGVCLAALCGALVWLVFASGMLERLRLVAYDYLISSDTLPGRSELVTTVEIDETSIKVLQEDFGRFSQWPRELFGIVYSVLDECGAKGVLFDILFDIPDEIDPGSDAAFAAMIAGGDVPTAFACLLYDSSVLARPLPDEFAARYGTETLGGLSTPEFNSMTAPFPGLLESARSIGAVNLEQDADGVTRSIRPFYGHGGRLFPALSLAMLRSVGMANGIELRDGALLAGQMPPAPIGDDGRLRVRFPGGEERYDRVRFARVWAAHVEKLEGKAFPQELIDVVKGRVVVVGTSAAGIRDLKPTPVGEDLPGMFIHAAALECFVDGRWSVEVSGSLWLAVTVLAAALAGLCFRKLPRLWALPTLIPASVWPVVLSRVAFAQGAYVDFAAPVAASMAGGLIAAMHRYFGEERRSLRLRAAFGKYLEPEVIKELEKYDFEDISPEVGRRRSMTVLFSDVRGFTSMSEGMPSEEVVALLNEYLDVMTRVIRSRHSGTHDKYIGDAIMAFWGAPQPVKDHALRAVRAAVDMIEELDAMQKKWRAEGKPVFGIGVGINTGEMVVGNVGSQDKLNYTVIGDEVNLGARLESLTREHDCDIIIGEKTAEEVKEHFVIEPLGEATVKGKEQPVKVFAVRGRKGGEQI